MSSTHRGGKRSPADNYATPLWCVHRALEAIALPDGVWCDPCAGTGNIIQGTQMVRPEISWKAYELRPECLEPLVNIDSHPTIVDFTSTYLRPPEFDVILMNPPYRLAQEFIEKSLQCADHVVALLRLNYLGSNSRNAFMRNDCPDVYVLPNRPSFESNGRTDSIEYAWMHWQKHQKPRKSGRIVVLPTTPKEERRW
jgi:hypothetical protein